MKEPQRAWLNSRARAFVELLGQRNMSMTVEAAEVLIAGRVKDVATAMGTGATAAQRYLDDAAIAALAEAVIAQLDDEDPGADLLAAPRTTTVPVALLGRFISGIAEASIVFVDHPGIDDNLRELRTGELTRLISVCGLIQSDHVAGDIAVPPALLTRIARHLDNAASIAADATLGDVLHRDATAARHLAG